MTIAEAIQAILHEEGQTILREPRRFRAVIQDRCFDAHKGELLRTKFANKKVDIGRFKGLGEMMPAQLKETTMDPATRTLARVVLDADDTVAFDDLVETLMGRKPELRFNYIQQNARFVEELDV
jgi:topoisomerase-4 subunit B